MASKSSSYGPSLFQMLGVCVCVCDQMHTGDLDKVQSLSTCYVTNEIILEPAVCSADISETVQRLLMNHGSQFCLLAHHTRQGVSFHGKQLCGPQRSWLLVTDYVPRQVATAL